MRKPALHTQIFFAIVLAVLVGWLAGTEGGLFGVTFLSIFKFVGKLFLNALKMLIVPLVAASIIVGMASISRQGAFGRIGLRTLAFYVITTLAAVLIGLVLVNAIKPGIEDGRPLRETLNLEVTQEEAARGIRSGTASDIIEVFVRMIPENVVAASADNNAILGIIFFSLLFGFFMAKLEEPLADTLTRFWQGVFEVMIAMTAWVMRFAPLGVFALVAGVVAETGFRAAAPVMLFFITVVLALLVQFVLFLPLLLRLAGIPPWRFLAAMSPALWLGFSTASSNAALPVNMECLERRVGVSERISNFVLPLGATVNQNGSALYECVAAIFLAQVYGVELGFAEQFIIVVLAVVTSMGVAGVPAASLVAITLILGIIGVPLEAIGILFVTDRVLDMMRTALNVYGDAVGAAIIARLEGERGGLLGEKQEGRAAA